MVVIDRKFQIMTCNVCLSSNKYRYNYTVMTVQVEIL